MRSVSMIPLLESNCLPTSEPKKIGRPFRSIATQASFSTMVSTLMYDTGWPSQTFPRLDTVKRRM